MADSPPSDAAEIDEFLAKFTDQLLSGTTFDLSELANDPEIAELQQMVVRLNRVIGNSQPTAAISKQIWSNLASEWQKGGLAATPASPWQQWKRQMASSWSALTAHNRLLI